MVLFPRNHFFELLQVKDPTEYYLLIDTRYLPVQPEWRDLAQKRGFEWERNDERAPYIWSLWCSLRDSRRRTKKEKRSLSKKTLSLKYNVIFYRWAFSPSFLYLFQRQKVPG